MGARSSRRAAAEPPTRRADGYGGSRPASHCSPSCSHRRTQPGHRGPAPSRPPPAAPPPPATCPAGHSGAGSCSEMQAMVVRDACQRPMKKTPHGRTQSISAGRPGRVQHAPIQQARPPDLGNGKLQRRGLLHREGKGGLSRWLLRLEGRKHRNDALLHMLLLRIQCNSWRNKNARWVMPREYAPQGHTALHLAHPIRPSSPLG